MGRRKKVVEQITAPNEDKCSNASLETKSGVEKLHSHALDSNALEVMNVQNGHQIPDGVEQVDKLRIGSELFRRSNRIKSLKSPTHSLGGEAAVGQVNLVEVEKEQEPVIEKVPEIVKVSNRPEVNAMSLEEKVDYLVAAVDDFKSKVFERQEELHGPGLSPNINYKNLYFTSQKKIEALMEDNYDLVRKLEFARGKIAAYEAMKDTIGSAKEVLVLGKSADIAASLSPQAVQKSALTAPVLPPHSVHDPIPKPKRAYNKRAKKC